MPHRELLTAATLDPLSEQEKSLEDQNSSIFLLDTPIPLCYNPYKAIQSLGEFKMAPAITLPAAPPPRAKSDLQRLKGWHHNILFLHMAGHTNKEIAAVLGRSAGTISSILQSKAAQVALDNLTNSLGHDLQAYFIRIQGMIPSALDKLEEIMEGESEEVTPALQLKAAVEVLDRGGLAKTTNLPTTPAYMEDNSLDRFVAKAESIGIITDADFEIINSEETGEADQPTESPTEADDSDPSHSSTHSDEPGFPVSSALEEL
jgi:hypothetical protein